MKSNELAKFWDPEFWRNTKIKVIETLILSWIGRTDPNFQILEMKIEF